jgi:hypothetical protein
MSYTFVNESRLRCRWVDQVYHEAVEEGKARGYPDALDIERILKDHAQVPRPPRRKRKHSPEDRAIEALPLRAGEKETLRVYSRGRADAVLSDDRGFLNALEAQGIPYLTPAAALVLLTRQAVFSLQEAQKSLERLRPLIREEQYEAARRDLQALEERKE